METQVVPSRELPNEMVYLSQKSSHLAAPGTMLNSLYYSRLNSTIELVESVSQIGRFRQELTSKSFNSSANVQIPNGSFLGQTYLHLELPNTVANQTLCRGWGLACIRQISFLFGSSTSSELVINKQSIWHLLGLQSESQDKLSEVFRLAGEEVLSPLVAPAGEDVPVISADILLPFPWSSINGLMQKKPYDTSLLMQPVTISIVFDDSSSIFGGLGVRPTGFLKAEIYVRQTDITNKDLSLKAKLMKQPDSAYNYPFQHIQSYQSSTFAGSRKSSGNKISIPLQSFINSDLSGIVLSVVKTDRLTGVSNNSPSPFAYDQIQDLELTLNGQTVYYAPGKAYKLHGMIGEVGASYWHNSLIASGTTSPFTSDPRDDYSIYIDFSLIRPAFQPNLLQNTFRVPQQTMVCEFYTSTDDNYRLFATYVYGTAVVSTLSNGESRILLA